MTGDRADVVVIGAGVIGSAVALELARTGRRVVCVDKGPAPGSGSTSASSSIIRFSYSTRDAILTSWEAAADWERWAEYLGLDAGGAEPGEPLARFIRTGMLLLETPDDVLAPVVAGWDALGIGYERLDAAELVRRFPGLDPGRFYPPKRVDDPEFAADPAGPLTAILEPLAGYVDDPELAARNLADAARRAGAEFRLRTTVTGVDVVEGRVSALRLDGGDRIVAPVIVNAAGPHSAKLNALVGADADFRIRHRPLRQEVFVVPAPPDATLEARMAVVSDPDLGQYFRPQAGGTVLVGGVEAACDPMEWVDDPDAFDDQPRPEGYETAVLRLARRIHDLRVPARAPGVVALYDVTDDWVPLYDRSALPGWFLACGTSGNQFKNAPMAGRFLAALVDAAERGHDHDAEPVRVRGARTGLDIDLGAFSRLRDPAATSGTVMG